MFSVNLNFDVHFLDVKSASVYQGNTERAFIAASSSVFKSAAPPDASCFHCKLTSPSKIPLKRSLVKDGIYQPVKQLFQPRPKILLICASVRYQKPNTVIFRLPAFLLPAKLVRDQEENDF